MGKQITFPQKIDQNSKKMLKKRGGIDIIDYNAKNSSSLAQKLKNPCHFSARRAYEHLMKLDVDPRRDNDASPMAS